MTAVVTFKDELVAPKSVRRKAGIKTGDRVEFTVSGSVNNIVPKLPYAEGAFTAKETAQILKARREMRAGRYVTLTDLDEHVAHQRPPRCRKTT